MVGADDAVLHGIQHDHVGIDQLHQVLVRGNDGDPGAGLAGVAGVGGDQVVGLESLHFDGGDADGFGRLADQGELGDELVWRRRAVRLVVGIDVVAEGAPCLVENHGDVIGVGLLDELHEHGGEAVDGVHRRAVGPRHGRQRVKGTEKEARTVDQENVGGFMGRRVQWPAALPAPPLRMKWRPQ